MKALRRKILSMTLCAVMTCFVVIGAFMVLPDVSYADSMWNDSLYHCSDTEDVMSKELRGKINNWLNEKIPELEFDMAALIVPETNYEGETIETYLEYVYKNNSLGYGVNKDGIMLVVDSTNAKIYIEAFGRGRKIFSKDRFDYIIEKMQKSYADGGYDKAVQTFFSSSSAIVSNSKIQMSDEEISYRCKNMPVPHYLKGDKVPVWYVEKPDDFQDFHRNIITNVVDNADLFTDDEEKQLSKKIDAVKEALGQDMVVFTDTSAYGHEHNIYAADFFTYCGYGYGDDFDGMVLFVCMDPDDRGFYTAVSGQPRKLWSYENSNEIDDMLYEYMVSGKYFDGVMDWTDNIQTLYTCGMPVVPKWYPVNGKEFKRTHNADTPRVYDEAGAMTPKVKAEVEERVKELSETYDTEIVVATSRKAINMTGENLKHEQVVDNYCQAFYEYNGYGKGDDYSGIMLLFLTKEDSLYTVNVVPFGDMKKKMTAGDINRLENAALFNLADKNYAENSLKYLKRLEKFFKSGKVPNGGIVHTFWIIISLIGGLISSAFARKRAKKGMTYVEIATTADEYVVPGSLEISNLGDTFLRTETSSHYSPIKDDNDSSSSRGSSSGGSSYHKSYSSSSGRSFSGSGRKF